MGQGPDCAAGALPQAPRRLNRINRNGRKRPVFTPSLVGPFADFMGLGDFHLTATTLVVLVLILLAPEVWAWLALRYISNDYVGIVEKLWSSGGSVPEGRIIALNDEAGYQAGLLRGGIHLNLWRWQYAVHKVRLVNISE